MFQITLLDHLKLTFGGVVHGYRAHSEVANRLTRRAWHLRIAELVLLGGALAANVTALMRNNPQYAMLSALLLVCALVLFAVYIAVSLESRVYAHRWSASRLWLIREKYRALLSEMKDGTVTLDEVRSRRDELVSEIHAVVEQSPPVDRPTLEAARQTLTASDDTVLTNKEIDPFLPPSLRSELRDETAPGMPATAQTPSVQAP